MFGFGVRTSQVFTSRWKALVWSAGILLTAYCSVPSADDQPTAAGAAQTTDASGLTAQQHKDAEAAIAAFQNVGKN